MVVDNVYIVECEYGVLVCGICNVQWIAMDRGMGSCCYVAVGVSVWYFQAHVSVSYCFVIESNGIYFATIIGEDTQLVHMCTNNAQKTSIKNVPKPKERVGNMRFGVGTWELGCGNNDGEVWERLKVRNIEVGA